MKKILIILLSLILLSCNKKLLIEQVDLDLKGMLENKVEVENIQITKTSPFTQNGEKFDSIFFDCNIYFTDDLFADDFKFNKGMRISIQNNVFIYFKSHIPQLVKLKFGKIKILDYN